MSDKLQRFIFEKLGVRGQLLQLDDGFKEVLLKHEYPLTVRKMLGEILASAVMLSATIKFAGAVTLQIQGDGVLSLLLAQCDGKQQFRGLAKWDGEVPGDFSEAVGSGQLVITLNVEKTAENYQAVVEIKGKSLSQAIESYFDESEQLPTRLWLFVGETKVCGLLLQVMPGDDSYEEDAFSRIAELAEAIKPEDFALNSLVLLHQLFPEDDVRVLGETSVCFHCHCSRERSEQALKMMPKEEREEILAEHKVVTVNCEFCNQVYEFDREDVGDLSK
ncbi:MAG: Hsp33 family molecular chaperone HslO [Gammaproteobacteria bacterium]|nr:Hsp33 family molecular chaperone HslO [Gammaproteobacteria bacterium]